MGVSHSILGRQIHTMGDHHDARVSKDLANRKNQKNLGFIELQSWIHGAGQLPAVCL